MILLIIFYSIRRKHRLYRYLSDLGFELVFEVFEYDLR
nr:MAG TPA: hypothetical protein [Caudoviricetes sp.]